MTLGGWNAIRTLEQAARRLSPLLRRDLDQADDDGLDVALRLDGLETQLFCKVATELKGEDQLGRAPGSFESVCGGPIL